jgi:hypothetical protein
MEVPMKKILLAAVVVAVALTLCAPAFAETAPAKFTCVGKIKAVDPTASTVTVRVKLASRGVADYLGKDLTIAVASEAKIFKVRGRRLVAVNLGDLLIGEKLRVYGAIDRSGETVAYVGKRLVMRHVPAWYVKRFAFRGPVTAVDAAAGTLTAKLNRVTPFLRRSWHKERRFMVAANARIWVMQDGLPVRASLADVVVGDRITAQGTWHRRVGTRHVFKIRWMIVRHAAVPAPATL